MHFAKQSSLGSDRYVEHKNNILKYSYLFRHETYFPKWYEPFPEMLYNIIYDKITKLTILKKMFFEKLEVIDILN